MSETLDKTPTLLPSTTDKAIHLTPPEALPARVLHGLNSSLFQTAGLMICKLMTVTRQHHRCEIRLVCRRLLLRMSIFYTYWCSVSEKSCRTKKGFLYTPGKPAFNTEPRTRSQKKIYCCCVFHTKYILKDNLDGQPVYFFFLLVGPLNLAWLPNVR